MQFYSGVREEKHKNVDLKTFKHNNGLENMGDKHV